MDEIYRAKPASAKGRYVRAVTLSSTMGPGVHIDPLLARTAATRSWPPAPEPPSPPSDPGRSWSWWTAR